MSKVMMITSALILGVGGIALTFLPQEIGGALGEGGRFSALSLQILGAAILGWAMTNYMARESLLGGIYGRPLVIGNLLHFFAGAMALLKSASGSRVILIIGIVYTILAAGFGRLLFRSPVTGPAE